MELPEMPNEGYAILVTPENHAYLKEVCTQLGESDYLYPRCEALNIYLKGTGNWDVFAIRTLPSTVFDRCTLIKEEQLRQLMFIYFLER